MSGVSRANSTSDGRKVTLTAKFKDLTTAEFEDQKAQDKQHHQLDDALTAVGVKRAASRRVRIPPARIVVGDQIQLPDEVKAVILSMVFFRWEVKDALEAFAVVIPLGSRLHLFNLEVVKDRDFKFKNSRGNLQQGKYSGNMERGKPNGHGFWTATVETHGTYEGEFCEGVAQGMGQRQWPTGGSYVGQFEDGQKCGHGEETWPTGGSYSGGWANNKRNGKGIERWPAGGSYEGDWVDGKRNGMGLEVWPTGGTYNGEYQEGRKHGWGVERWPTGGWYAGNYCKGRRQGYGQEYYPEKTNDAGALLKAAKKYEGEYGNNTRNGLGAMIYEDSSPPKIGMWKRGKFRYRCQVPLLNSDHVSFEASDDAPEDAYREEGWGERWQ